MNGLEWLDRMKDAIDYIESKLSDDIDIEEVAKRACSSRFHFQRMFHMLTGVTVAEYIRRRRLTMAAQELAMSATKVFDVSLKYRYESPESFAKAFRKAHGLSPSEARAQGVQLKAYPRISFQLSLKGDKEMDYKIVHRNAFPVIGKSIRVSLKEGDAMRRMPAFWSECQADGTIERLTSLCPGKNLLGIKMKFDDDDEQFTYIIAVEGAAEELESGWITSEIPAATWAMFPSVGPLPKSIQDVWMRIFQEWFPATGYQHAEAPEMEVYPLGDTMADDYRCEVWIPVNKD